MAWLQGAASFLMYKLYQPAPELSPFVESYWSVYPAPGERVDLSVEVFVDGRSDLLFNFGAPYTRTRYGEDPVVYSDSNLDAQRTYPITISQKGAVEIVGVRFQVGGLAPFVRPPLAKFTDQTPNLVEIFGNDIRQVENELRKAGPKGETQKATLDQFFLQQLRETKSTRIFQEMLSGLTAKAGSESTAWLAKEFSLTPRSVARHFHQNLGLSPALFSRILRFQSALKELMRGPSSSLGQLAADCGYFDQAHFIKDFKAFAGGIPGRYREYFPEAASSDFAPNVVQFIQD